MAIQIETATRDSFDELIAAQDLLVVVYFWGPDCPNCEVFARDLPDLLEAIPQTGIKVVKVNAYEFPELARRFALFGIPGFVLFKGGKKLGMMRQYNGREFWKTVVTEQALGITA
jgi:thioredoxin-like negative regulator of GroEL